MSVGNDVHVELAGNWASGRVVNAGCGYNRVSGRQVGDGEVGSFGLPGWALVKLVDSIRGGLAASKRRQRNDHNTNHRESS